MSYSCNASAPCLPATEFTTEDIVLGPPKTAFASASRVSGKSSIDATERPSRFHESEDPKDDRYNFRERFFKDRDVGDKDFDRRDGRPGLINPRRGDREDWGSGRPRRPFAPDDPDRKPLRRNGDPDRWEGRDRDPRDFTGGHEKGLRDKEGRFIMRRDGPGRPRFEGSWIRDGNPNDGFDADEERPSVRSREWRRDRHGADREWFRGTKLEQEPEWLDSSDRDRDDNRRVHTQEDFERWKEKMKASSAQAQAGGKRETPAEQEASEAPPKPEIRPTDGDLFSSQSTPFQADLSMEKFFGLLGDLKPNQEVSTPLSTDSATTRKEPTPARPAKSSRFAGLFSPPADSSPASKAASPATEAKSLGNQSTPKDPDQEGFQRILQMLGGGAKSRTSTPRTDATQYPRPPSQVHAEQARTTTAMSSPALDTRPDLMMLQHDSPIRDTAPLSQETPLVHDPFKEHQAREREHLLRLMQQIRISPTATPLQGETQGPHSAGPAPGMLNMSMPELLSRPQGLPSAQKQANFLDDPAIANVPRPEGRRMTNGLPMNYFDDVPFSQANQLPFSPGGSRVPQVQPNVPLGLQRPPGFDHVPRPGWAGHQIPQQGGGPSPLAPPPGIPTPNRSMNPNFMMPMQGNMPFINERERFPRGAAGGGAAGFGPPPGMIPPPGYMNINGPVPSGFPPMPHASDPMMGLGHGPYGGINPGPQGMPPSSRHLLDMLGQANTGNIRGGMVGPGQFR